MAAFGRRIQKQHSCFLFQNSFHFRKLRGGFIFLKSFSIFSNAPIILLLKNLLSKPLKNIINSTGQTHCKNTLQNWISKGSLIFAAFDFDLSRNLGKCILSYFLNQPLNTFKNKPCRKSKWTSCIKWRPKRSDWPPDTKTTFMFSLPK